MSARIAPVGPLTAAPLALLHAICFPEDPWDAVALERVLGLAGSLAYCAWQADAPVGFVLARDLGEEFEILSLGVVPEWRRVGIARALLQAVFADAERRSASIVLEVAADNTAARRLYAGLGLLPVGRRPRYYRRASGLADALILRRATRAAPSAAADPG